MNKKILTISLVVVIVLLLGYIISNKLFYSNRTINNTSFIKSTDINNPEDSSKIIFTSYNLGVSFIHDNHYGLIESFKKIKTVTQDGEFYEGELNYYNNPSKRIIFSGANTNYNDDVGEGPMFSFFKGYNKDNEKSYGVLYTNPNGVEFRYEKETGVGETEDASYWTDYEAYYLNTKDNQFPGLAFYAKSNSDLKPLIDSIKLIKLIKLN